jgi:hypothetical protein
MRITETPPPRALTNRGAGTDASDETGEPPLCLHLFSYIQRNYITKYHLLSIVLESHQLNRVRLRHTSRCLAFNLLSVHSPPLAFYAASMFCLFFTRRRKS